ncbi:Methyltransferase type 11 [Hydrogenobacter thermophilus TK-6]|uniref:Menaquinone biosynthesis methyltransferase n=1 Tax=Hydrogenobacter thermophilus (strain DSM 6534 / IAM 12695 / TK-6) TaxID=608538 RepID=D3DJU8_HYDTT|nr:class I SAM-dependent methyltransferase [Hydrogenobacter thermophilus]ADO46022.1 Methyltransferase type 11 [Hydrogenobacter thermophilus TK-6]BAI70100.1 menaquinone biosynthesis methyltransferase [Hydrogenobacter thermophilus TK-6]
MEKHRGYQEHLASIRHIGLRPLFRKLLGKHATTEKIYYRLTNISVKKLIKIPNIKTASKVLDVGCGTGEVLNYIKKFINPSAELYGVDLEKNPVLPDYVSFLRCDIEEETLPFEENSFDIVISNFVIEHLKNPQKLFTEGYRVLKRGGYFYCTTEYYTSLFCPDGYNFYSDPTHVRPWTKKSLKTLAKMCGFEVYQVKVLRWWEYLPLLPVFPLLNLLTPNDFSFIPYEIVGRTVYIIARKP